MKRLFIFSILLFLNLYFLKAQQKASGNPATKTMSLEGFFQYGTVLKTNDFVRGDNAFNDPIDEYQAFSVKLKWKTSGDQLWEQLYKNPEFGIGIYSANFDHSPELGYPISFYGFFSSSFYCNSKFSFGWNGNLGITFNWESFDLGESSKNIAIGAEESVYIDLGLKMNYQLSDHWNLGAGAGFTHFSNGALKKPNNGINTFAPKILLSYDFVPVKFKEAQLPVPEYPDHNSISISAYTGWKNVLYQGTDIDSTVANRGVYYNVHGISTVFNRQINYKSKIGFGVTLGYFGAANSHITAVDGALEDNDATLRDGFELSIFPSYELVINKVSVILQPGFYLHRSSYEKQTPVAYQRIGIKYHFLDNLFIGANLHAYSFYISDYIEWNVGYLFD